MSGGSGVAVGSGAGDASEAAGDAESFFGAPETFWLAPKQTPSTSAETTR